MGPMLTIRTSAWIDLMGEVTTLSYIELATDERWRDYFYTFDRQHLEGRYEGLLGVAMPIRPEVISDYTKRFDEGATVIERRFKPETNDVTLPNIVELAMWWVAKTKENGKNHGLSTNHKTQSSTRFRDGVLCIEFVRYEWLEVNVGNPTYTFVSPMK